MTKLLQSANHMKGKSKELDSSVEDVEMEVVVEDEEEECEVEDEEEEEEEDTPPPSPPKVENIDAAESP